MKIPHTFLINLGIVVLFVSCGVRESWHPETSGAENHTPHHGVLIRSFDKVKEFPVEGQIPVDYEEYTYLYPIGELGLPNRILLLPDRRLYDLLSSKMVLPANWLVQQDSISAWFSVAPSFSSSTPSKLEKRVPVAFDVKKVDESTVGKDLHMLLVSDYSCPETDYHQAEVYLVDNLSKTESFPTDSLLVVIDGILNPVIVKNKPLELLLKSFPFMSEEDVKSLDVYYITGNEAYPDISCHRPNNDILFIVTGEESDIHDFTLNGKPVHKRKGISLGCLLDEEVLKQKIKKNWRINPKKIETLVIDGRKISITTMRR